MNLTSSLNIQGPTAASDNPIDSQLPAIGDHSILLAGKQDKSDSKRSNNQDDNHPRPAPTPAADRQEQQFGWSTTPSELDGEEKPLVEGEFRNVSELYR